MFWSWLFPERKPDAAHTAERPNEPAEAQRATERHVVMPAVPFDPTPPAAIGIPTPAAPPADAGVAAAAGAAFLFGAEVANRMHPQATADAAHQADGRSDDGNHHHGNQGTMVSDLGSIGGSSGDGGIGSV